MKLTKKAKNAMEKTLNYYKEMHTYYYEKGKDVLQQEYYGRYRGTVETLEYMGLITEEEANELMSQL